MAKTVCSSFRISGALVDVLAPITGGALKVYLYLCHQQQENGEPVNATPLQIGHATGLKERAVKSGLKWLREKQLIRSQRMSDTHRVAHVVAMPEAALLEPARAAIANPPAPAKLTEGPSMPVPAADHLMPAPPPPSSPAAAMSPLPAASIEDLVAATYRRLGKEQLGEVRAVFPAEADLRRRLRWLKWQGGVEAESRLGLGLFLSALESCPAHFR